MAPLIVIILISLLYMLLITGNYVTTILASDCHAVGERFFFHLCPPQRVIQLGLEACTPATLPIICQPSAGRLLHGQQSCEVGVGQWPWTRVSLGLTESLTSYASLDRSLGRALTVGWPQLSDLHSGVDHACLLGMKMRHHGKPLA